MTTPTIKSADISDTENASITPEIRKPAARATRRAKIIVFGAGPSGGACALALARTGRFEVQVLDRSQYPRVKVCGSGLSPHALTMLGRLGIRGRFAGHGVIDAVLVRGPAGGELRLHTGIEARVVPRAELDQGVIRAAVDLCAHFDEGTKVLTLLRGADGEVRGVKTETGELEADLMVCADGSPSRFASDPGRKQTIQTLMGWWRGDLRPQRREHQRGQVVLDAATLRRGP
jgi:flavin-dependent dehydrogenase